MKKIMFLLLLMVLAGCAQFPLSQVNTESDPFVKLPAADEPGFVSCTSNSQCVSYLENHGVYDVAAECRETICYYENEPVFKVLRGDVS